MSPSSRGLGCRPFTAKTGVRIPLGMPFQSPMFFKEVLKVSPSSRGLGCRPFTAKTGVRIPLGMPPFNFLTLSKGVPIVQRPRMSPFHGEDRGSNPLGDAIFFVLISKTYGSLPYFPPLKNSTSLIRYAYNFYSCVK